MKALPASPLRKRLGRFARWFFNVSLTAQLESAPHPAVARAESRRVKRRR
jgi:hypothetical protein